MDYKLKTTSENDVEVILPAGSDFVRTLYPESKVNAIIAASNGKIEKSDFDGFLKIGEGELYVAGTIGKAKAEKADEAPKAEKAEKKIEPKKTTKKTTNTKKKA